MRHEDIAELVAGFYEVGLGHASWRDIGARLERLAGAQSSLLWHLDASGRAVGGAASAHLEDPGVVASYIAHYSRLDPWSRACASQPGTRARRGTEFLPRAELERSEWYAGYCRDLGIYHVVGAVFPVGAGGESAAIALHRPRDAPDFATADLRRLDVLLPHLRRALQLGRHIGSTRGQQAAAGAGYDALDALATAAVVADGAGRVVFANRAAEAMAREDDGLRLSASGRLGGRTSLDATHPADRRALLALVRAAALGGPGGGVSLQRRGPGLPPLAALVAPLPSRLGGTLRPPSLALILVAAPSNTGGIQPGMLARLHDLTPAEAEVALALAHGASAEEAAATRGVGVATVRSQARAVLAKTGCDDLRDLARKVGALEALRRD